MKISRFRCFWASTRTTCACFPVWDCQPLASCPFSAHCWMICPSVTTISPLARPSPGFHAACKPPTALFTFCGDRKARPNTKLSPNLYLTFLLSTLKGSYWPQLSALLLPRPCCPSGLLKDHFLARWFVIVGNLSILPCVSRFLQWHTHQAFFWVAIYRVCFDIQCGSHYPFWREDFLSRFTRDVVVDTTFIGLVHFRQQQNFHSIRLAAAHCTCFFLRCRRRWACFRV